MTAETFQWLVISVLGFCIAGLGLSMYFYTRPRR